MERFTDWNRVPLAVRFSRGESRVPYVEDWRRNVIGLAADTPVPPWLIRQVRSYVARRDWFEEEDAAALATVLGRISKFQSLQSEDALTWSWFGTLAIATPSERTAAIQWLYDRLGLPVTASGEAGIRQWDRVLHPNAVASPHGPEVDAIVDDPAGALIYVEAKWGAELGTGKGASAKKPEDQIVLRRDSLRKDPALKTDERSFIVLGVAQVQAPGDPVFVTRTDRRQTVTNVDHRIKAAIKAANVRLGELGIEPISERVTPHSLRRTYASLRAASGDDPVYIAEQLGHEDPNFSVRVYAKAVKRRDRLEGKYLDAFDRALNWAGFGQRMGSEPITSPDEVQSPDSADAVESHGQAIIRHQGR